MKRLLFASLLLLAACNREDQPEPPSQAESDQLNNAEAMLDQLANEEGAAPEGTAPTSNQQ